MSESKFSKTVCAIIKSGCGGHVSQVEAAASAAGIPDLDYCVGGNEGHIELKYGHKNKMPELRPSQVRWFKKRVGAGGSPFFLCLNNDTDEVYYIEGIRAENLAGSLPIHEWKMQATWRRKIGDDFRQKLINILS